MLRLIKILRPVSAYIMLGWMLIIIAVSSMPHLPVIKIYTHNSEIRLDYFMHFCEYGFLSFMTYLTFTGKYFTFKPRKFLFITFCLLLFAVADELHQKFIPGRTVNPKDLIANFAGILAALIFCIPVFRKIGIKMEDTFRTNS